MKLLSTPTFHGHRNEEVFLVYFFCFNLEELAKEQVSPAKQQERGFFANSLTGSELLQATLIDAFTVIRRGELSFHVAQHV